MSTTKCLLMVMRVNCSICWKSHTSCHESVWLFFLRGRDARFLLDYILDQTPLACVVGRETSSTCQGLGLKALASLTSAACEKHKDSQADTLQQRLRGERAPKIDTSFTKMQTQARTHMHRAFPIFTVPSFTKGKRVECKHVFAIFPCTPDRARIIEVIYNRDIFLTHRYDISLRIQTVSVSHQWGMGWAKWAAVGQEAWYEWIR